MANVKLTYFDFAGSRGEEVRLALSLAGVAFDDIRIERARFGELKPDTPFGSLPFLEIEGKGVFGQSNAILRLIGSQHGLHPADPFEAARHDALMDAVEELRGRISPTMYMTDEAVRLAARQELASGYIPLWATCVERQIGDGPFVGGARVSVADIKLYMVHSWISRGGLDGIPAGSFDACPKLCGVAEAVRTHPGVVAWYARPE